MEGDPLTRDLCDIYFYRNAVETCENYNSAVSYLSSTRLVSPAYLQVVGTGNECCVIERSLNSFSLRPFCSSSIYLVQTNVDFRKQSDERQHHVTEGFRELQKMNEEPNITWLKSLMEQYPVYNELTFMLLLVQPETGLLEAMFMTRI